MVPSQELELKFSLTSEALEGLLKKLGPTNAKWQPQTSVYYDTPKHKLFDKGIVLRVRHRGDQYIQTMKTRGASALIRQEWEKDIPDDKLVLVDGETTLEKDVWQHRSKLQPIFSVIVERLSMPFGNVQIDIDKGCIERDGQSVPVCEVEFELKSGRMAEAVPKMRELLASVAAELSFHSKSERGFALALSDAMPLYAAEPIALEKSVSAAEGFQAIALSCLSQVSQNKIGVQKGEASGVHQMRIGLRRLRAATSIFKDLLQPEPLAAIVRELKWLTGELGPARDFEVLLSDEALKEAFGDDDQLSCILDRHRLDGIERAKAAVESERYRALLLETVLWIVGKPFNESARASLSAFAEKEMSRRLHKILKKLKQVDELDDLSRHQLRIAVKKLRYGVEFFQSLFGHALSGQTRGQSEFLVALKSLQDGLGRLHDFAVHREIFAEIDAAGASALDKLLVREEKEIPALLKAIGKSGQSLAKAATPW